MKYLPLFIAFLLFSLQPGFAGNLEQNTPLSQGDNGFIIVSHRGGVVNDSLLENSLEGLEEAINRGYTHLEVDLQTTKDGHVVCFHERNLSEITGIDKNLDELTLAELKSIAESMDAKIFPTFEEYCAKCQDRINLMPDIKYSYTLSIDQYIEKIKEPMIKYGLLEEALILGDTSYRYRFRGESKISWRYSAQSMVAWKNSNQMDPADYYFVFNHAKDFNQSEVDLFHSLGVNIIVSINTFHYSEGDPIEQGLNDIVSMIELGVDGLQIDSIYDSLVFAQTNVVNDDMLTNPVQLHLHQNYPNPFNPVTNINYSLSHAGYVNLTVYDLLGRPVAVLVDKNQKAGEYQLGWNAAQFPSGVYIYRLKTSSKVQTRKMILVK